MEQTRDMWGCCKEKQNFYIDSCMRNHVGKQLYQERKFYVDYDDGYDSGGLRLQHMKNKRDCMCTPVEVGERRFVYINKFHRTARRVH